MALVSIGNGLYAQTRDGNPRRRPVFERAEPKRDANGKFTKTKKEDKR